MTKTELKQKLTEWVKKSSFELNEIFLKFEVEAPEGSKERKRAHKIYDMITDLRDKAIAGLNKEDK